MFYIANANQPNYGIIHQQDETAASEENIPVNSMDNASSASSCLPNGMPFGTTAMQELRAEQEMQGISVMPDGKNIMPIRNMPSWQEMTPMPGMMFYCPMMYRMQLTPNMYNQMMTTHSPNMDSAMNYNSTRQQGAILPFLLYGLSGLGAPLYVVSPYYNPYFVSPYNNPYLYNGYDYDDYDYDYDNYYEDED